MPSNIERESLTARLAEIDRALAENEARARTYAPCTYGAQECKSEYAALKDERARTEEAIRKLDNPVPGLSDHQRRCVENEVARRRAAISAQADKFDREGDFRNARLQRQQLVGLRERVIREYGWHIQPVQAA